MSTILKALQKIEPKHSGSDPRGYDPERGVSINLKSPETGGGSEDASARSQNRRQSTRWSELGVPSVVIILLVLVVGGGWFYLRPSKESINKQHIKTFPITKTPSKQNALVNTQKVESKGVESKQPASTPSTDRKPLDKGNKSDKNTLVAARPQPQKDAEQTSVKGEARGKKAPEKTTTSLKADENRSSATTEEAATPKNQAPVKKDQKQPLPNEGKSPSLKPKNKKSNQWKDASLLKNKRMLLQALAWSSVPEKRMGVIDGLVVREGDEVNGFTVVEIQKRDMILTRNGQYFRLEFKQK